MSDSTQPVTKLTPPFSPELLAQLRAVTILSSMTEEDLECLREVEHLHLNDGDFIARQGEAAHYYWILLNGRARLFQTHPGGHETTHHVFENAGEAFGELPLLANVPNAISIQCVGPCDLLRFDEHQFWNLMTDCPEVRKAILGDMANRFQRYQSVIVQQEKMASLGILAAGLMHELNNPGAAAGRAAGQLRQNLLRMHELTAKFSKSEMTHEQKECMFELQDHALAVKQPLRMNSLEQSDAEEALATWMENAHIENAWKLAPTLVSIGLTDADLSCARNEFPGPIFSDALSWLEALVSSMQLVGTIEESIGRVSDLVKAVKSYAYENKGQSQTIDVNESVHATLVMLGHKIREKEIALEKQFDPNLPLLQTNCSSLNQIWTNLLDNAIDAVPQNGRIAIRTWQESSGTAGSTPTPDLCISIIDSGEGIPLESQPHIFDPFYTTKPVGIGTGLGLGIVHRLVEQLGGSIRFTSVPGQTEFLVRIPAVRK